MLLHLSLQLAPSVACCAFYQQWLLYHNVICVLIASKLDYCKVLFENCLDILVRPNCSSKAIHLFPGTIQSVSLATEYLNSLGPRHLKVPFFQYSTIYSEIFLIGLPLCAPTFWGAGGECHLWVWPEELHWTRDMKAGWEEEFFPPTDKLGNCGTLKKKIPSYDVLIVLEWNAS